MKLKPEIKARWVAALRSGDYKKTMGALARKFSDDTVKYCCLGVLCEIAVADGVIEPATLDNADLTTGILAYGTATGGLPDEVSNWVSGENYLGDWHLTVLTPTGERRGLAALNDNERWTFAQIADAIEEQL